MGKLLKTFGIYFAGNIINRLMGFVVMSIATYKILPADYGYFNVSSSLMNIIITLVSVQAWMAVLRFVFDYDRPHQKRQVIATGYFIEIVAFLVYSIGFWIVCLIVPIRDALPLYIMGAAYVLVQNTTFTCRSLGQNRLYVFSGLFASVIYLLSCILFIFGFHMTSSALILSMAMSYLAQGFFIELFLKSIRNFRFHDVNFKLAKKMLRYCIPTALNQGTWWINTQACTLIITICINEAAVGIYSAASKMTSLITMIVMVFNLAFQEFTFSISHNEKREKQYNLALDYFIRFISCGMLLLLPVTSVLFNWIIGPDYEMGRSLVPLLYLATFLDALASFIGSIVQAEKKVNMMFLSQIIGAVITIGVMLSSIWFIGLQSAALAMLFCFLAITILRTIGLHPQIRLHYDWKYFGHYTIVFLLASGIYLFANQWMNLLIFFPLLGYVFLCLRKIIREFLSLVHHKFSKSTEPSNLERN